VSTILTVYSNNAFKRFLLPAISNADYSLFLAESLFDLPQSIDLKLENNEGVWYFSESEEYDIQYIVGDDYRYNSPLFNNSDNSKNEYKLLISGQHRIAIITQESNNCFATYDHFSISSINTPITIGRDGKNVIAYDYHGKHLLSGEHAALFKNGSDLIYQDFDSSNGSYINNKRVKGANRLVFGDCIDLFGLRIVCLGDEIAINVTECGAQINAGILQPAEFVEPSIKHQKTSLITLFHRSPRRMNRLETDGVKIDDPPAPKEEARRIGIMAALGSALSMALPMFLGCSFMILASRLSGVNRGIFMYVGLVTASTSAIIGCIRSISGMRRAAKEYEQYETLRSVRYGNYLKEQEAVIQEKYERNTRILRERYLSATEVSLYNAENPLLWNRNSTQEDFMSYRLGIGELPFQVDIQIPDKKFSMTDNNLFEIPGNLKATYAKLKNVPVCLDLMEHMLVGMIGGSRMAGGIKVVRDIIIQAAANNSYTDVKIALVYDKNKDGLEKSWDFVRWLPHVWNETKTYRYVASGKEEASNVFYEISKIIRQRSEERQSSSDRDTIVKPHYILIIAAPEFLEGEMISQYILEPKTEYGISTIYMTERYEQLPNNCVYVVENDSDFHAVYDVNEDIEDKIDIEFDNASIEDAERLATTVASIEVEELETGGDIPNSITFFEMYGVKRLEDFDVLTRWRKNRTYESMKALVGQRAGGADCYLDIHEKYHGPHGLVAGTTGSGKSETLQTYILSLAINFSPDDVSFFIIDYKGGGMANLFEELPHMIGQISNLSGNQINRALLSIQSEKDRREALFANYGVKDIRDYTKLYKNNEATIPLPHLIIVIDEFAEMKKEEPEFIQEIVSVSRVGRSLGIHLIMATQKPAGSVSDDIWANSRFKLCLRVQSKQDSMDMLHKPDAAYLTQSGRCYLQVGNDELYELFQSGYSGAIYYEDELDTNADIAKMLTVDGTSSLEGNHARLLKQKQKKVAWIAMLMSEIAEVCGHDNDKIASLSREEQENVATVLFAKLAKDMVDYPENEHNKENLITLFEQIGECGFDAEKIVESEDGFTNAKKKLPQQPERTQLEAVVGYLKEIAEQNNYNHDFSLFMPLLPENISLAGLSSYGYAPTENTIFNGSEWPKHSGAWRVEAEMGLYDDPENQRQDIFTINFAKTGNILLLGAPNTGKTTFLQTLVLGMIRRYSPAEVNLYIMQFSAHKFTAFEKAPHVGGIIKDSDTNERIDKFFVMLELMLAERKRALGEVGFEQYTDINGKNSIPAIFVIIDGFGSYMGRVGDKYHALIGQLAKEGINNGIYLIVSAGGIGSGEISNNLAQVFRTPICLELNNSFDYGSYMRATRLALRPESGIRGRGVGYVSERILEFQTAIAYEAENEQLLNEYIAKHSEIMAQVWTGDKAPSIPEIPEEPIWSEYVNIKSVKTLFADSHMLPIGYDSVTAAPFGLDLKNYYSILLTGGKKKGKSNALKVLLRSAQQKGASIIVIDFDRQTSGLSTESGILYISSEVQWGEALSELLKKEVVVRNAKKGELRNSGAEDSEIFEAMQQFKPIFIFIEDLASFVDHVVRPREEGVAVNLLANMEMIMERGALHNIYWVSTLDRDSIASVSVQNLYKLFVREKKGLHFGGAVHATAIAGMNFDNHERKTVDALRPAGRAMLPADNEEKSLEVVLPLVKVK